MTAGGAERRTSPRYPIPIPLRFRVSERRDEWRTHVVDLSEGGIAFSCPYWLGEGTLVSLVFPLDDERFSMTGAVAYCREGDPGGRFRVGLYFLRPTIGFRIKLAVGISAIREARKSRQNAETREISLEDAARNWVDASAGKFPDLYEVASREKT